MILSLAACTTAPGGETSAPVTTAPTDAQPVSLSKIVVYSSSLCTVLESFGKTDTIVGAYGSLSEKFGVPECGKWNEVDVEAVIATGAEAIFGYAKYTTEEQISKLKEAGIECYFISWAMPMPLQRRLPSWASCSAARNRHRYLSISTRPMMHC